MSVNKNYYVIAGYDLTNCTTEKFEDWRWSDEGEKWFCYKRKGQIQMFDDPMNGDYLYLGFILAAGDEYDFQTTMFDATDINDAFDNVSASLSYLRTIDVIEKNMWKLPEFKIIAFVEYT